MKDCSKIAKYILGWYVCPQPDWSKDDWDKCSMRVCADVTHLVYTDTGVLSNSVSVSQVFFLISHIMLSIWVNLPKLKLDLRWMHSVQEEESDNLLHDKKDLKYDKWTLLADNMPEDTLKAHRVGSRKSELALIQTRFVISELEKLCPGHTFTIVEVWPDSCHCSFHHHHPLRIISCWVLP